MELRELSTELSIISKQLSFLQQFISVKFGLDFKEFCRVNNIPVILTPVEIDGDDDMRKPPRANPPRLAKKKTNKSLEVIKTEMAEFVDEDAEDEELNEIDVDDDEFEDLCGDSDDTMGAVIVGCRSEKEQDTNVPQENSEVESSDDDGTAGQGRSKRKYFKYLISPENATTINSKDPLRHQQFDILYKTTKKGNEKMIFQEYGYSCMKIRPPGVRYWKCSVTKCPSRLVQSPDGAPKITKPHDHPPQPEQESEEIKSQRTKRRRFFKKQELLMKQTIARTQNESIGVSDSLQQSGNS